MKTIDFEVKEKKYSLPNSWEDLTPELYLAVIRDIDSLSSGEIPPAMVNVNYLCHYFGWIPRKLVKKDLSNLAWLAEQVDFIFNIEYPEEDEVLSELSTEERMLCKKVPPERLSLPIAKYLVKLPYKFVLNGVFCAQLLPVIKVGHEEFQSYKITNRLGALTTSLTALQYIEARNISGTKEQLPLLAAILYHPGPYDSESAHLLAEKFQTISPDILQGIAFNFQAFTNWLFLNTEYKLLTVGEDTHHNVITTGALESLYNLASDGYGSVEQVENMNLLKYLTLIRKKLIDTVRSMHANEMKLTDIASDTGLPITIINQII